MSQKEHFHTLDGLRFFAFFKVYLLHLPIAGFTYFSIVKAGGGLGVEFFFVLSGFLISYLCLKEKSRDNTFSWKYFFMRRILRIWPLYFLMIGFAYATPYLLEVLNLPYSNAGYEPDPWYSIFFLENYKMMQTGMMPNVSPLGVMWSLCIEEHFYIIWALVFVFIPVKRFIHFVVFGIVLSFLSKIVFTLQGISHGEILTHLDLFCYGGLLAYALYFKPEIIEKYIGLKSKSTKRIIVCILILMVLVNPWILNGSISLHFHSIVYGLLFIVLIALFLSKVNRFGLKEANPLNYLGKISYGLYVYHIIVINLFIQLFIKWNLDLGEVEYALLFVVLTFGISVFVSSASYHFFEKPFLILKKRFRN